MIVLIKTLAAVAAGTVLATNAFAQSPTEVPAASPYVAIANEPAPKLIVDPTPLAAGLAIGIVWIQYHAENVRIVPVFGTGALNAPATPVCSSLVAPAPFGRRQESATGQAP